MNFIANNVNWNDIYDLRDPNTALTTLIKKIQICVDKSTVSKVSSSNTTKSKKNEWITKAIIVSCKTKETLYSIWKRNPANEILKNDYKSYCKILDKVIKNAKLIFEKKISRK